MTVYEIIIDFFFYAAQSSSIHWLPSKQCPSSFYTTAIPNNGTEVTGVLHDSNFSSCLALAEKSEDYRLQIRFPLVKERAHVSFKIMGHNLVCIRPRGVGALGIGHCKDNGECSSLPCTPTDLVMPQKGTGCEFKCHCKPVCAAIVLDISGLSGLARTGEICEIVL